MDSASSPVGRGMRAGDDLEPLAGSVASAIVTILTTTILATLTIVFAIFLDSWLFVFVSAILKFGVGLGTSFGICQGAILLCLVCYVTTKLIYIFLVEKAVGSHPIHLSASLYFDLATNDVQRQYIIRQSSVPKPRLKSKLYIFNTFGMLGVYTIVSILNFIFRITRQRDGECIIGMQRVAMIPLITFDLLANVYLTILFLLPLRNLYNFRHMQRNAANERLRTVAFRTFIGAVATTMSSIINLTVLMVLDGEPGWVCLTCCNVDIAFSAIVVHWVTSKDKSPVYTPSATSAYAKGVVSMYQVESASSGGAGSSPRTPIGFQGTGDSNPKQPVFAHVGTCIHECKSGTGCYGSIIGMGASNNAANGGSTFGTTIVRHPSLEAAAQRRGRMLHYGSVVVGRDGQPVNKAFMTHEAIAMYHYHHHRYMNGGSSNRYPFTKSSSVSSGTLEPTRGSSNSEAPGRSHEFRKYGGRLFADNIDPLELDEGEEGQHSSDEDCEYELVLRKKRKPGTPPILPAELDPVVNNSRPRNRQWSVAQETTLVVESRAADDDKAVEQQKKSGSKVFGTRTVCLGGEHNEQCDGKGECSAKCGAGAGGGGSGGVAGTTSLLKKVGKLHSRSNSGVTSEDGEAGGSKPSKKEVSWRDVHSARESIAEEEDADDFVMWDGTQGDRSSRVEPEGRPGSFDSKASMLELRLEEV
ncbi:uncharacterized protein B0I36DRAFT_389218 [Microdochium trichocladiopsis]|uniref:Uncharacterized protein n=1 Tax=Microdochium trichocladiopsis TaxID=1682393 RepID=A0A9P9BLN1_9PEZI|nr:uncharacterized protein B0I36DRAFT_389218 [Microdochium trichocladiopsis]KAH7014267.1 hypothetical protein B0I36DRAFT_389218 [Microdochium trichocladiopsis]